MTERSLAFDSWSALERAHSRLGDVFSRDEVWSDASMHEFEVLQTLSKTHGAVRLTELNREIPLSQPGLSRLVDRLVARGLVARRTDPADRRGILLSLTETGSEIDRRIADHHRHTVAATMYAALNTNELEQLETICEKLYEHAVVMTDPLTPEPRGEVNAYATRRTVSAQTRG